MQQRVDLNLASRPFRNNTLLWTAYVVSVAALIWFTWWGVERYRYYGDELAALQERVSTIDSQMNDLSIRDQQAENAIQKIDLENLTKQAEMANKILEWKAFSWTTLFNLLEELQPYGVKMNSIRPSFYTSQRRTGQEDELLEDAVPVTVQGEANDRRNFLELQRSLMSDIHFDFVAPRTTNVREDGRGIMFELRFVYFPEGAEHASEVTLDPLGAGLTPRTFEEIAERERQEIERLKAEQKAEEQAAAVREEPVDTRRGG